MSKDMKIIIESWRKNLAEFEKKSDYGDYKKPKIDGDFYDLISMGDEKYEVSPISD